MLSRQCKASADLGMRNNLQNIKLSTRKLQKMTTLIEGCKLFEMCEKRDFRSSLTFIMFSAQALAYWGLSLIG